MSDAVRYHVWVSGLVQGVFYRASAAREAQMLGLSGWVRNLSDGRVEAVLEGPPGAVERMVEWMRIGPPHARVEDVVIERETPLGELGFTVRG